jgi:phosphoribosyl 1,2-cyclic phosphate phosphodiesterase
MLEVRILGCGSSGGVPRLGEGGPNWGVCDPANPKNRRSRCSIMVTQKSGAGETRVLVDTSPDLREQLLAAHIGRLDGVLITHDHADQTHGMDDLRVLVLQQSGKKLDMWSDKFALDSLNRKFSYIFQTPPNRDYPSIVEAHVLPEPFVPFEISGPGGKLPVNTIGQSHGRIRSLGFRFGGIAYSPDVDGLDEEAFAALNGLDCWIVDALRHTPHPSHAHLSRTLEWIARVKPKRAILTNMHVDMDYDTLKRELPAGVEPAYDGMIVTV